MLEIKISTIILSILLGSFISGVFLFLYAQLFKEKRGMIKFFVLGKFIQLIAWSLFVFWGENITGNEMAATNIFIFISSALEVYSIILVYNSKIRRQTIQLTIIVFFSILFYFIYRNDILLRVVILSFAIGLIYSFLLIDLVKRKNQLKIGKVLGWFVLIFVLINLSRGLLSYTLGTELPLHSQNLINIIAGFSWGSISLALPLLFLLMILEKDNNELREYKLNLESKVNSRTQELEESLEREKELGVLKTNFISMASHEFRTPLAAINATADVLDRYSGKLSKEDIHRRLNKIKTEIKVMTTMLEDVLTIGKSEAHQMEFHPIQLELAEKINEIISDFQLGQDSHKPILFTKPESEIILNADPKLLKNIVTNLISNAFKYSDSNVEINLTKENDTVVLSVKDYGIGIPKKDLEHLFEPFHRGENVGNASGTGLGLTIVQNAVKLHTGTIDVQSEVGVGTTFRITFPL